MGAKLVSLDKASALHSVRDMMWALCRPKSRPLQCRTTFLRRQRCEKCLHRRTLLASRHQRKIIMLFRERNEAKSGGVRDGRNGHTPVGTILRHRRGDRVV